MSNTAGDRADHAAQLLAGVDEAGDADAFTGSEDLFVAGLHPDTDTTALEKQIPRGNGPCDDTLRLKAVPVEA